MCKFMTLAHAQFTVSGLQQGPNENGWPASSDPCVCVCVCSRSDKLTDVGLIMHSRKTR